MSNTATILSTGRARAVRLIGILGLVAGIVLIVGGGVVWGTVSSQLAAEKITVSEDASFLAGAEVRGPLTAFAQADIIQEHALAASDGLTYAELEQDDPVRTTMMNASFLRASLFTSVVSFGVSAFAIGTGLVVGAFGWALTALVPRASKQLAD
ncbi:aromatic ring-opening dioxygenase LigA [Microbacterium betulae]|uniref:Aromatic ring-opening dioxygenase LigA n=1 Tax=Microbacterium betulae TaxID=2981139 RepID=A0AA97FJ83_9MICO|nr:aromatic ring-opening dioxygenase LigA [Microbacterium sp. AB]WOF22552.1 aromatic ring-opening dioxygenase LigA [Microbacterium sp. AB]